MKKTISLILASALLVGMAGCGSSHVHSWKLDGERPVCTDCEETRDGTTAEAVQYIWKNDIDLDNGSVKVTNTYDTVTLTLSYSMTGDYTLASIKDTALSVYASQGSVSMLKSAIDGLYNLYLNDATVKLMSETYVYFDKYCGSNLKTFNGETYYGTELVCRYENGVETYNFFNDELGALGYYHS